MTPITRPLWACGRAVARRYAYGFVLQLAVAPVVVERYQYPNGIGAGGKHIAEVVDAGAIQHSIARCEQRVACHRSAHRLELAVAAHLDLQFRRPAVIGRTLAGVVDVGRPVNCAGWVTGNGDV